MVVGEPKRSIMEGIENTGDVRLHDHRLRLKQRFDIIRKLGQGTYGKVQLGINKKTGQEVAIKTIKKCKIETEADLVRIRREVQIMSSVRHPNIVHIYEVFENSEKMILVMEYCAGGELYDYLSQQKVLQEDEARRLFRQIATAVYYCHKHKICHRDLKLENVLLDEHGSAKIADFGLSNVFEERRLLSTFCGSPLYASPEIVKGTPYIGPEVDCWSLGVLLYTLVYGAMPFDGSNFKRLVKQISTGDYFEPKSPSSASPLIRDMLTVDPVQRADITHICDDPWVNKGSEVSCLELAEALANETPVRLDLLLSLAPPPIHGSDKLVVTDEITSAGPDGSPARSTSVANVDNSAERRILEMVAEGGTDAIKPSPTRTIVSAEQQPKRKLETTVSMDSAPSQRKKERTIRSSSISQNANNLNDTATSAPSNENAETVDIQRDASMKNEKESDANATANEPSPQNVPKRELSQPKESSKLETPALKTNMSQLTMEIPKETSPVASVTPTEQNKISPVAVHANKESKTDIKSKDPQLKEKSVASTKPVVTIKKKIVPNSIKKDDKTKSTAIKEKSPPRKSIEKDIAGRVLVPDKKPEPAKADETVIANDVSTVKQPTERRRSRILDAAEKLNSLSIQPNQPTNDNASSPPLAKPKKVMIPGVSVGSFKEQFERRASLTSGSIPVSTNEVKKPVVKTAQSPTTPTVASTKMLGNKKIHSVDSEHPDQIVSNNVNKESANVRLQHIGVEPVTQPKEEPVKVVPEPKRPAIVEVNKVSKPLHKSISMKEPSKPDTIHNSLSLEDARRSLQQSMALLSQAKSESKTLDSPEDERQKQLKSAREIISNAIGDETLGKKVNRLCMGGKPPVPYGSSGRSASGNISLSSLNSLPSSPPISPPHSRVMVRESPVKTFRTEVQHKVDDVRNKYLPNSRGGSVERIIPIQFAEAVPKTSSGQLPYQRHNTTPYRFSSLPRGCTPDYDSEQFTQHSVPATPAVNQHSTPSTPAMNRSEPIKKSPREFIIPIAVEGKGYVTPRQGSLEPSETPTKITPPTMSFPSRFSKPRRLSSLVSGGESEDDDDLHMHRLRSSRRIRVDPEKESVSSGEEDDDEGFELLTAENLFSTLLDRVRSLTNKLNGEEGTGFPQHSLFNNFHSQFFNSPHLPRKHKRHDIIREGAPWRRSTSRDISSNFDSMFPSHPTFPRGSKKSRKAASSKIQPESLNSQKSSEYESKNKQRQTDDCEINSQESLDLSDLDLSKIELSEKDMETLSGLTPALSRRLQKQLLDHLPPAAARSLRRTLSMNNPINSDDKTPQHKYTRSLSASKTADKQVSISEEENLPVTSNKLENNMNSHQDKSNDFRYQVPYFNDDDTSSISCSSTSNKFDKENNNLYEVPTQNYYNKIVKHNQSSNSLDYINTKSDSSHSESITPRLLSSVRNTPERSVLSKYFSPERTMPCDDYLPSYSKSIEMGSLVNEPSYLAAYGGNNSNYTPGGSLKRRSLRTPPADATPRRRVSRFLRPDFFDTPREESIYVRDKKDKESETQKILKEIREKRNRSGASSPISPMVSSDITSLFESASSRISSRNCLSPVSPLTPNRSRSVTPFYPILDNINENQTDNTNKELQETLISIDKKLDESNSIHASKKQIENAYNNNVDQVDMECSIDSFKESKLTRPKSFPSKQNEKLSSYKESVEENKLTNTNVNGNISKIARPKSYPATTPSPEKKCNIPLIESQKLNGNNVNNNDISNNSKSNGIPEKQQNIEDDNGNVSVSFSVSLPSKTPKKVENNVVEKVISEKNVPEKNISEIPAEVPEKKKVIKKKIVIKKKSASAKSVSNGKTADDIPKKAENGIENNNGDASTVTIKNNERKSSPKKKSVLQSLGQKFEKLRSEKCSSQERESTVDKVNKTSSVNTKDEPKPSRIENVMRVLRERSVPAVNDAESITESGLIKRAVTITNLPTLDDNKEGPKKTVNRVFGLFKKIEPKDKSPKPPPSKQSVISETNIDKTELNNKESEKVETVRELSPVNTNLEIKPKRPTSLLLNGIGKRVQACYNGATSDSVLTKTEKNSNNDVNNQNTPKAEEAKTQKKGLRLDFSRLPKLNQGIFTKRNSLDLSKSRENSESKEVISPQNNSNDTDKPDHDKLLTNPSYNENVSNGMNLASPDANWSPDLDTSKFMISQSEPKETTTYNSHQDNDPTGDSENIIDRIRRKSFYSRFNEKKNRRKSSLVGPGAKEYIPSARINPQCDNDNAHYPNKYDLSPTSPNKYISSSLDHSRPSHSLDKNDCLTPTSSRLRNSIGNDPYLSPTSHKAFDRSEQKYSLDSMYPTGLECNTYSIPRYSRTLSYFDDYDSRQGLSEPKSSSSGSSSRYGRTLSLLSPGIYATYSPRSHTRNSAILLRDSADDDVSPDSVLNKIRNRKKAAAQSMQLEDDHHILDTKFRSPSYQLTCKKSSVDGAALAGTAPPVTLTGGPAGQLQPPQTGDARDCKKPGLAKVLRGVASSSISDSMSLNSPIGAPGTGSELDRLGALGLPSATQALPDAALLLVLGRAGLAKPQLKMNKIVVYISAADSQDCCVEKGMLHSEVASELRVWCRTRGWQLHVVDLHWRTPLEAQRDHEFPRLCLSELARHSECAYVIPVLFLNSSLGTPLLPLTIESSDFRVAVDSVDNEDDRLLLNRWYEVDSAASPPCYRLTERGNEDKGDEERRVLAVFQKVLSVELRDAYLTTVIEQEVHNTVLMSQELARRCLWINRVFIQHTGKPEHDSVSEKELQRRLAILQKDLKSQLVEKHIARAVVAGTGMDGVQPSIPEHAQYLSGAQAHLAERLKAAAEAIIDEHASRSPLTHAQGIHASMFEELNNHTVFCQKTAQSSVNRETVLNHVKSYIVSDSTQCFVIVGASGSGKSTLIARAAQCCHQWSPDAFLAFRFVGITNMSSTVQNILSSVVNQSSIIMCGSQYVGRHDIPTLCEAFQKIISEIAQQRPTLIMIDGLDQIQGFDSTSLDWIPTKLPDNVKIVITVAEGQKEACPQVAETLRAKLDSGCFINMPDLDKSEARSIVMSGVVQYNHSVNAVIQESVLKSVGECNIPLHAKILAWRTSVWQAWGARAGGSGSAGGALAALEELCGEGRLRACLGALTASRHGLADHEMVDLLARDKQFHSEDTYLPWAPAAIFWARASARLAPFLWWGGDGRARWRDRALKEAARECFFPQAEMHIRNKLVDYFEGKWYEEKDPNMIGRLISQENKITAERFNARKLEELPYQRYHLCKPDLESFAMEKFFTDDTWIFDKISALGCGQLLEDIGLLELTDVDAPEHIRFLKEFLEINSFALNYDAKQYYTLMYLFLEEKSNNGGVQSEICQKWYENAKHPPIPSLVPLNLAKPSTMGKNKKDMVISELFDAKMYDLIVRLEKCDGYVASLSTEREEICVWDLAKCKKVRTLQGVTHPINLVEIDQFRCVVLCRRELRVYDLNTGTFITPLKGVMNQKMPFYGLHDPSHLVCLSRNRMYVNLMNTDTGDCVTTFKAGEDRFLNSLLVSGDGRMLVCGDETQKPFPLLVWNLSSRKLLYDLRIPHHDFITSLAAITHEGSYVCVVALELDEPTPNFIVVYDLQSGTLFKKWKPGRDTASLAISSADGCVVSGLDDARILVWDLVTGNCRYTLWGHTGAVTCLRLAPNGGYLLSSDIRCRDRSVRLWDLHSGTLISVFTPPERVSSCEILSGGRHVALALESHKDLVTLSLVTNSSDSDENNAEKCYGDPENEGKVFDLRDKELGNGC